jgi:hypothetical protein
MDPEAVDFDVTFLSHVVLGATMNESPALETTQEFSSSR